VPEAPLDPAKIRIETSPGAPRIIPNSDIPQSPAPVDPLELGHEKQANRFVMALCADKEGRLYIGTEGEGIWRYNQKAPVAGR
jgi:ligand-binding sensor domain-containing protein